MNKPNRFPKDQLVLIIPGSLHSIQADSKLTVLVLVFSQAVVGAHVEKIILDFLKFQSKHYTLNPVTASEIRLLFRKMLFEQTNFDTLCRLITPINLVKTLYRSFKNLVGISPQKYRQLNQQQNN